jgi:signal transduction histidine kinase
VLVAAVAGWRLAAATRPARRILAPVLLPGILLGAGAAAYAAALLRDPAESPADPEFMGVFLARCAATLALAAGLAWTVLAARGRRNAVSRLAAELGEAPAPGSLRQVLARAAGDPGLEVAYWLEATRRYVDAAGRPVDPPRAGGGRAVTPLVRDGRPVAVVAHDAGSLDASNLDRTIGAAARVAVDNERLQAEAFAQLHELRASRVRIVETGDAERRRLERDLHDGAQQRLLALSYDLRLARAGALADGDAELATLLATTGDQAQLALSELRDLAHGIYPAILTEAGLGPALMTLADEAPLPVEIDPVSEQRYSAAVEAVAYRAVVEAVQDAACSGASHAHVRVASVDGRLLVEVRDDGEPRTSPMLPVADRVGALGGRLDLEPTLLRAEIPCA